MKTAREILDLLWCVDCRKYTKYHPASDAVTLLGGIKFTDCSKCNNPSICRNCKDYIALNEKEKPYCINEECENNSGIKY